MKLRNFLLGLHDQLPLRRFIRNYRKNGGLAGFWHPRTHFRADGAAKIMYNTRVSAEKAALAMEKKTGNAFGKWKCFHCDGYHIGKNSSDTNN